MSWRIWILNKIDSFLNLSPRRILYIYIIFGTSWILFSDWITLIIAQKPKTIARTQTIKGFTFILFSSPLISGLIKTREVSKKHSKKQLESSNELLDVLSRILRHNIRNEANIIMLHSEFLKKENTQDKGEDGDRYKDLHLDTINKRASNLIELTESTKEIRNILKKEDPIENLNISSILETSKDFLKNKYPKTRFYTNIDEGLNCAGVSSLKFAFKETIRNGIEHNEKKPSDKKIWINAKENNQYIKIEIADNAEGIPKEELEPIIKREEIPLIHGSRLNLWLVNWIVNKSLGSINYEENKYGGTTIKIKLQKFPQEIIE